MKTIMYLVMVVLMMNTISGQVDMPSVVNSTFFDEIMSHTNSSCEGKEFYTREAFLEAVKSFPMFAEGTTLEGESEIAAFFAHATYETQNFCIIDETAEDITGYCTLAFCDYPCNFDKTYHGRGPLQLRGNCNYGALSEFLELDLINHPELLSTNATVSFKSAIWYWMNEVHSIVNQGFGATIRVIDEIECDGNNFEAVFSRANYYRQYCKDFGVTPGLNQTC